jgi:hypothetical protein
MAGAWSPESTRTLTSNTRVYPPAIVTAPDGTNATVTQLRPLSACDAGAA